MEAINIMALKGDVGCRLTVDGVISLLGYFVISKGCASGVWSVERGGCKRTQRNSVPSVVNWDFETMQI